MALTRADLFPGLIVLTSPHERSAHPIPRIFEVTLQSTKLITQVDGKDYCLCHRLLLQSLISVLFHINSLLLKGSFLLFKLVYSIQNASRVSCNSFSVDPANKFDRIQV